MSFIEEAEALQGRMVELRRRIHSEPECGLHLPKTQATILEALEDLPLEITLGTATTSVTAVLRGDPRGPVVLLRADMDALPLQEETGLAFASQVPNAMHACGHDLHVSMLAGAATMLSARRHELPGDVIFMFQPGEEGHDGAGVMLSEGVLESAGREVDTAYAVHVFSASVPDGKIVTRPGTFMAGCDELRVTVRGRGGHGSTPHLAQDPVQAMAEMITNIQVVISRSIPATDPAVVSVGVVQAGTAATVIPENAHFKATVRTFSVESRERLIDATSKMLQGVAAAHGVEVDIEFFEMYPVTVNDHAETELAVRIASELFGEEQVEIAEHPFTGSEDFSRILARVPGTYFALGAQLPDLSECQASFNHSAHADFDEAIMPKGAALLAELGMNRHKTVSEKND